MKRKAILIIGGILLILTFNRGIFVELISMYKRVKIESTICLLKMISILMATTIGFFLDSRIEKPAIASSLSLTS